MATRARALASEPDEGVTPMPPSASSATSPVPCDERIGRYHLRFALATGGMATVYLAVEDAPTSGGARRVFAIKRIHPHLALSSEFVDMFRDEARIASLIHHPNVCGVLDCGGGETGEPWWLAMDLLVGHPLARLVSARARTHVDARGAARWALVAARIVAESCDGLHAAHELRDENGRPLHVVHRDVSPHNLFVGFDGHAKVVDFGIATAAYRVHQTATGMVKGKFAYMAPEQMRGARVDRRADVWSLGVVLWEAISGRPLFRAGTESETILRALAAEIPPLATVAPHADPKLATIVDRALKVPVASRHASARELGDALWEVVESATPPVVNDEVVAWMDALFPGDRQRQMALVDRAAGRKGVTDAHAPTPSTHVLPSVPSSAPRMSVPAQSAVVRRSTVVRHASRALIAAGALALLGVVLAAGMILGRSTGTTPSIDGASGTSPTVTTHAATRSGPTAAIVVPAIEPATPANDASPAATPIAQAPPASSDRATESARDRSSSETAARGEVHVATSGGWADVFHRGRRLGPTPGIFRIPVGRQVLTLRPSGNGEPRRTTVVVRSHGVTRLRVALARRSTSGAVSSLSGGAAPR